VHGLTDRVMLVAGGATGMGAATARRLAAEGAKVVVGDINISGAEKTAHGIETAGGAAIALEYDQSEDRSIEQLVTAAVAHFGALHGVHANAADLRPETLGRDADLLDMDLDVWQRTLRVNLIGYALVIRAALPHLLSAGGGGIVCTTSDATRVGEPTRPAYAAAKGGVNALIRHVASRWGKERIRCNAVSPGTVMSETGHEWVERLGGQFLESITSRIRSDRVGQPDDIAGAVAFLLSADGAWVNGQVWSVNGGSVFRE
jgi:NAD(P)-dependent dehydrogenase (short-subunit alcohol dehydrogenase family)